MLQNRCVPQSLKVLGGTQHTLRKLGEGSGKRCLPENSFESNKQLDKKRAVKGLAFSMGHFLKSIISGVKRENRSVRNRNRSENEELGGGKGLSCSERL